MTLTEIKPMHDEGFYDIDGNLVGKWNGERGMFRDCYVVRERTCHKELMISEHDVEYFGCSWCGEYLSDTGCYGLDDWPNYCPNCGRKIDKSIVTDESSGEVIYRDGAKVVEQMPEYIIDTANMEIDRNVEVIRCFECKWLGREFVEPGEYRCERTERMTTLDGFCSFFKKKFRFSIA